MSVAEMKRLVDAATSEERLFLEAYLDHLRRENDPSNGLELDDRMKRMDAGDKVSLARVMQLHEELRANGQ